MQRDQVSQTEKLNTFEIWKAYLLHENVIIYIHAGEEKLQLGLVKQENTLFRRLSGQVDTYDGR